MSDINQRAKQKAKEYAYDVAATLPWRFASAVRNRTASTDIGRRQHLLWMCENLPDAVEHEGKFFRWLGFVQGAMWGLGLRAVSQLGPDVYWIKHGKWPEEEWKQ
jgi:hypothetical protein